MKIGILTLPLHTNYGGILQAYALQTVLERMGHEVCLIEKKWKPFRLPLWKTPLVYGKRVLKNLAGHPYPIFYEQKVNREEPITRQNTDLFINRYIKRRIVDDFSELKESDFDAIVVGSDQIWRPKYFKDNIGNAYLKFAEGWNIKRIAYAASFGTNKWEYTAAQTKECAQLLKQFDAVSVREASGVDLCRKHFGVEARHVLDPTMLLSAEDYIRLFETAGTPKSPGTLLCYILDETPQKTSLINEICKKWKLQPFRTNSPSDINLSSHKRIYPPVEQWLRGFHDAKLIITDSFHACAFSILFNKPFIVIENKKRGVSRITSLLHLLGLENNSYVNHQPIKSDLEMDWNAVNASKKLYLIDSMDFLSKNLI